MSDKKLKRRLNAFFRLLIILSICVITVYLFPKVGSFQYEYQKGMPWRYETLTAPFDFPIHKTEDELQEEREKLVQEQSPIFILNTNTADLQTGEFVVDTATDGEMALQKMAEQRYDMILLDVRLKEENGWESVRRFKQVQREVAVVLFTSDYEVERLTDVFGVGVEDYLEKSSDIGILANRLKALHYRFVKSREQQECYRIASEVFFRVNAGILVVKGKERYLKSNEACLLKLLCRKMGTVVKIEELYAGIWGKAILFDSKDKALRNLVSELRKTLEGTGLEIRNKRFAGYCLKGE